MRTARTNSEKVQSLDRCEGIGPWAPESCKLTAQQVRQEDEDHAIYRNWCEVCVASCELGQKIDERALAEKAREGPKVCSNYFLSIGESQLR